MVWKELQTGDCDALLHNFVEFGGGEHVRLKAGPTQRYCLHENNRRKLLHCLLAPSAAGVVLIKEDDDLAARRRDLPDKRYLRVRNGTSHDGNDTPDAGLPELDAIEESFDNNEGLCRAFDCSGQDVVDLKAFKEAIWGFVLRSFSRWFTRPAPCLCNELSLRI